MRLQRRQGENSRRCWMSKAQVEAELSAALVAAQQSFNWMRR